MRIEMVQDQNGERLWHAVKGGVVLGSGKWLLDAIDAIPCKRSPALAKQVKRLKERWTLHLASLDSKSANV